MNNDKKSIVIADYSITNKNDSVWQMANTRFISIKKRYVIMSSDMKTIPLLDLDNRSEDDPSCSTGCGTCSSTGCAGGLGIRAGSEKDVVYKNIFLFVLVIVVMIVSSFLIVKILTAIFG